MEVRAVFEGPFSVAKLMREQAFADRLNVLINRALPGLSHNERTVLAFAHIAAQDGLQAFKKDEITHAMGLEGTGGTNRGIEQSLERKGHIKVEFYQRGRKIWVAALDKWTADPPNQTPHWRTILERSTATPTLPIHRLREVPTVMAEINLMQREFNMTFEGAQLALMSHGVSKRAAERSEREAA